MDDHSATPLLFEDLFFKPTTVTFDEPNTSSDGGVILLNAVEKKMGLGDIFVGHINDTRQQGKIQHTIDEMVRQRIFGMAAGYTDGNDTAKMADDPVMKMLVGLKDLDNPLASQSTL